MKGKGLMMSVLVVICACMLTVLLMPKEVSAFQPQSEPPGRILELLNQLKEVISGAVDIYPTLLTGTNTLQQANALYNKIDVVIGMVQQDNTYKEAIKKLEMDIAPKVNYCDTARIRARSWLSDDPELQDVAYEFAGMCQGIIEEILTELHRLENG